MGIIGIVFDTNVVALRESILTMLIMTREGCVFLKYQTLP